jgi:hypothetical protein
VERGNEIFVRSCRLFSYWTQLAMSSELRTYSRSGIFESDENFSFHFHTLSACWLLVLIATTTVTHCSMLVLSFSLLSKHKTETSICVKKRVRDNFHILSFVSSLTISHGEKYCAKGIC